MENYMPAEGGAAPSGKKYMHGHFWVKILVIIIVLVVVFKAGEMVGEFKSRLGGEYGSRGMMIQRGYTAPYGAGMMGNTWFFDKNAESGQAIPAGGSATAPSTQAAPATPQPVK